MLTPLCLPPPKKLFLSIILTTDPQISLFAQLGGGGGGGFFSNPSPKNRFGIRPQSSPCIKHTYPPDTSTQHPINSNVKKTENLEVT